MKCYPATGVLFAKYNQSVLMRNPSLPASQHFLITALRSEKKKNNLNQTNKQQNITEMSINQGPRRCACSCGCPRWGRAGGTPGPPGSLSGHSSLTRPVLGPGLSQTGFSPLFIDIRMHESKEENGLLRGSSCHLPPDLFCFLLSCVLWASGFFFPLSSPSINCIKFVIKTGDEPLVHTVSKTHTHNPFLPEDVILVRSFFHFRRDISLYIYIYRYIFPYIYIW